MGKHYAQLTVEERVEICRLHVDGKSRRTMGALLGRSAATLSRELRRNSQPTSDRQCPRHRLHQPHRCGHAITSDTLTHNSVPGFLSWLPRRAPVAPTSLFMSATLGNPLQAYPVSRPLHCWPVQSVDWSDLLGQTRSSISDTREAISF
jgi:hypothetical protein